MDIAWGTQICRFSGNGRSEQPADGATPRRLSIRLRPSTIAPAEHVQHCRRNDDYLVGSLERSDNNRSTAHTTSVRAVPCEKSVNAELPAKGNPAGSQTETIQ